MAHIVLIACVSKKGPRATRARDLYQSPLFKASLAYAEALEPDAIYILSSKHGLLAVDTVIDPYDDYLKTKSAAERRRWAARVLDDLRRVVDLEHDQFTLLAGQTYREFLMPSLRKTEVPLAGIPGVQVQVGKLKELLREL